MTPKVETDLFRCPAHHVRTTGHNTHNYKIKENIRPRRPCSNKDERPLSNRTDSAPKCSKLWDPIQPKIVIIKPRHAGISFLTHASRELPMFDYVFRGNTVFFNRL